ncbi:ribonuclease 3-like protein 1 [Rhodamnia argentea]|uniref:Ribonuclease 3-like protein 1 n=1 Tax=Rhodamnia argentea TaxID=178133 RepID=A0A8B8NUR2_9MYRT|nr:ribonuclease 3-like protein 1 [Rhodamnia argentea]
MRQVLKVMARVDRPKQSCMRYVRQTSGSSLALSATKTKEPSHSRQFSFKVITEVKDESRVTILECFSAPRSKKNAAAQHAAEGALWYLKHLGYPPKKRKHYKIGSCC